MLQLVRGNLLEAEVEALVNAVNTVGVMGKGLALQYKRAFPEMYADYVSVCKSQQLAPGLLHVFDRGPEQRPRFLINLPTKRHWKSASKLEDVQSGLDALAVEIPRRSIRSIAVPALGCGLGGLDWNVVRPMIESTLGNVPNVDVFLYAP